MEASAGLPARPVQPTGFSCQLLPLLVRPTTDRRLSKSTFVSLASSLLNKFPQNYNEYRSNFQGYLPVENSRIIGNPAEWRKQHSLVACPPKHCVAGWNPCHTCWC